MSNEMIWANIAIMLARNGKPEFQGRPSPHSWDAEHNYFMLHAVPPDTTLREFVAQFDGCSSMALSRRLTECFGRSRLCNSFSKKEADELLMIMQSAARPIDAQRLCPLGKDAWEGLEDGYFCEPGFFRTGTRAPFGHIGFLVEVFVRLERHSSDENPLVEALCVNRTPSAIPVSCVRQKGREVHLFMGESGIALDLPRAELRLGINITTPYVPLISMSKAPDLHPFRRAIRNAAETAARRAHRRSPRILDGPAKKQTRVDLVLEILPDATARSGSNGRHQYGQRGLFYKVREPFRLRMPGIELKWDYFTTIITDYENEHGDIPGLYRDNRGRFYTPRIGSKPLGTLVVAAYQRPPWMYAAVLFCEKEDHLGILEQDGFAERWDCLLVASKGFASRAARDLIDLIAATANDEPVRVLAIHDGDAYGTLIMQALQEATKARGARSIQIIDLGLNPWDERAQSLEHETGLLEEEEKKNKGTSKEPDRKPVADYVRTRDRHNLLEGIDEPNWEEWLQDNRVELNAMTSQELIDWVEEGFISHGIEKVVPPVNVLDETLRADLKDRINEQLREEVLRNAQAWMDEQGALRLGAIDLPDAGYIKDAISEHFARQPSHHWKDVIKEIVKTLLPPQERRDEQNNIE
jgi:hypothetical protein